MHSAYEERLGWSAARRRERSRKALPAAHASHFIVLAIREKLAHHPVAQRLAKERDDSIARKEEAGERFTPEEEAWWRHKLITSPPIDFVARHAINEHARRVEEAKKLAPRIL